MAEAREDPCTPMFPWSATSWFLEAVKGVLAGDGTEGDAAPVATN